MDTTTAPNRTKHYLPSDDPLPELRKHLTTEQLYQLAQGIEFVKAQTGYGTISIDVANGNPRRIRIEYSADLEKPK